jgi:hypothetical protein
VRSAPFRGAVVASLCVALSAGAHGTPKRPPPRRHPAKPFPAPPTLPLVRVEVARDHVLIVQDVLLRRGDWSGGDLDAFVAFGAPGIPRAVDARIYRAADDDDEDPAAAAYFDAIPIERAAQRPGAARLLLGSATMAGAVLHLRDPVFRRATSATGIARVRIRTLLDVPAIDVRGGREVVIRLGTNEGEPDALGTIEVRSTDPHPWVTRAEAHLCGPDADPWPLAVRSSPALAPPPVGPRSPVAPVLSVRHATDDLCVRFWTVDQAGAPHAAHIELGS